MSASRRDFSSRRAARLRRCTSYSPSSRRKDCAVFRSRRPAICFSISRAIRSRSKADENTCSGSPRLTAAIDRRGRSPIATSAADSSGSSTRSSTAARAHPEMHVYHYAPYEPSAFKRLMGRYATRERELDAMLRAGSVRRSLRGRAAGACARESSDTRSRTSSRSTDFAREVALEDANRSLQADGARARDLATPSRCRRTIRAVVEGYNRDDCVSTLRLRDWLETVRGGLTATGVDVPRPFSAMATPAPPSTSGRSAWMRFARVFSPAFRRSDPTERASSRDAGCSPTCSTTIGERTRRRWWEYFRLCELAEEDLYDEREAVAGMEFVDRVSDL